MFPSLSAGFPVKKCGADAVLARTVCLDRYEASVWRVPNPTTTNASLVRKVQLGRATEIDLTVGGATQLGTKGDDYARCADRRVGGGLGAAHDALPVLGGASAMTSCASLARMRTEAVPVRCCAAAPSTTVRSGPLAVVDVEPFHSAVAFGFRCGR